MIYSTFKYNSVIPNAQLYLMVIMQAGHCQCKKMQLDQLSKANTFTETGVNSDIREKIALHIFLNIAEIC